MKLVASLTSPYARKIRVALAEKGLPFTLEVDIPWLAETSVPDYNPLGKVPALVADDGEVEAPLPEDRLGGVLDQVQVVGAGNRHQLFALLLAHHPAQRVM